MIARLLVAERRSFLHAATFLSCAALIAFLGALLFGLLRVALSLRVDYYDSYHLFSSARALVRGLPSGFDLFRPLGATLLYTPLFARATAPGVPFPACHVQALLLFTALLATIYRLYRLDFPRPLALLALTLFATNPLVIHSAPFCKEDLPATLFTSLSFLALLTGSLGIAAAGAAAAMLSRYNALALLPPMLVAGAYPRKKGHALCALSLIGVVFVASLVYARLGRSPLELPSDLWAQFQYNRANGYKPPFVAYRFLARAIPPPLLLCALWGIATALYRRERVGLFHALWLVWFFLVQAYLVAGKEARYLFPLYPPLYYLALRGLSDLTRAARAGPVLIGMGALILVLSAARQATSELAKFSDPAYTTPFAETVSAAAARAAGPHPLYWIGPLYALHPREFVYDSWDDYAYLFHYSADGLAFFTDRPVALLESAAPEAWPGGALAVPGIGRTAPDGAILIVNPEPTGYVTRNAPAQLKPLVVERVRIRELPPQLLRPGPGDRFYASFDGIPEGRYELYLETARTPLAPVAVVEARGRQLNLALHAPSGDERPKVRRLFLVSYDRVGAFGL